MSTVSEWRPYENYVQSGLTDGKFLNAGFTLLAAGPPRLAAIGGQGFLQTGLPQGEAVGADDIVFPIGIVQNFNLSHNRQFNRIFEIGSERSFFISGRTVGQIGLSRIMYHGPSLLRTMYAYYVDLVGATTIHSLLGDANPAAVVAQRHDVVVPPGYDNLYLNLASDMFSQPVGLMAYFRGHHHPGERGGSVRAPAPGAGQRARRGRRQRRGAAGLMAEAPLILRLSRRAKALLKLSTAVPEISSFAPGTVVDDVPHGTEGRLRRRGMVGKRSRYRRPTKLEGPRAYAPRLKVR
jgi:hypothetical protein